MARCDFTYPGFGNSPDGEAGSDDWDDPEIIVDPISGMIVAIVPRYSEPSPPHR